MMLVDSHAHLEMPDFKKDLEAVIQRAKESGIGYIFTVGTEKRDWKRALEIANSHPSVYAILGVHPHNAKEIDGETYPTLQKLCRDEKVKAYGEIGLDFYRNLSPRDIQLKRFREQIGFAKRTGASYCGSRSRSPSGDTGDSEIRKGIGVRGDHPLFLWRL